MSKPDRGGGKGKRGGGGYGKLGSDDKTPSKSLTIKELMLVLGPFFWPNEGTDGAVVNRIRSTLTWVCVGLSKTCSLISPLYLSSGTNNLTHGNYSVAATNIGIFCALRFLSSFFKEMQSIVFLKVKQQAYIQLAETTFAHLHELSLNWHLTKKTGNVIRSMDRGTEAASQLVSNVFLFLGPAILECIAVCIIFFTHFKSVPLGCLIITAVAVYILNTIVVTKWRKKFREATNKHDNDFHEKATDSIINFETVKYFTMEKFEVKRFKDAVSSYQKYMVSTQAAGSFLNASQAFILNSATLGALLLAGWQVKMTTFSYSPSDNRDPHFEKTISSHSSIHPKVHTGQMDIGNFVAVNAYVSSMFAPLNFLGYIYQGIIQG
jgi:ATP-binding cassette, subfamily B, heavy metal transporter